MPRPRLPLPAALESMPHMPWSLLDALSLVPAFLLLAYPFKGLSIYDNYQTSELSPPSALKAGVTCRSIKCAAWAAGAGIGRHCTRNLGLFVHAFFELSEPTGQPKANQASN